MQPALPSCVGSQCGTVKDKGNLCGVSTKNGCNIYLCRPCLSVCRRILEVRDNTQMLPGWVDLDSFSILFLATEIF